MVTWNDGVVIAQPDPSIVSVSISVPGEPEAGPQVTVTALEFALETLLAPVTTQLYEWPVIAGVE